MHWPSVQLGSCTKQVASTRACAYHFCLITLLYLAFSIEERTGECPFKKEKASWCLWKGAGWGGWGGELGLETKRFTPGCQWFFPTNSGSLQQTHRLSRKRRLSHKHRLSHTYTTYRSDHGSLQQTYTCMHTYTHIHTHTYTQTLTTTVASGKAALLFSMISSHWFTTCMHAVSLCMLCLCACVDVLTTCMHAVSLCMLFLCAYVHVHVFTTCMHAVCLCMLFLCAYAYVHAFTTCMPCVRVCCFCVHMCMWLQPACMPCDVYAVFVCICACIYNLHAVCLCVLFLCAKLHICA